MNGIPFLKIPLKFSEDAWPAGRPAQKLFLGATIEEGKALENLIELCCFLPAFITGLASRELLFILIRGSGQIYSNYRAAIQEIDLFCMMSGICLSIFQAVFRIAPFPEFNPE